MKFRISLKKQIQKIYPKRLMNKLELRKKFIKLRKKNFSKNLNVNSNRFLNFLVRKNFKKKIIGGYYPYNYEMDTLEVLQKLEKKNFLISLPKITKNNKMYFYLWSFKDPLTINTYGIPEPISNKKVDPDLLLIPLLAYDSEHNRLGYGGGFYDRYISVAQKRKKLIKIGFGFSYQKTIKLPVDHNDKKLDYILTEKNFIQ